MRRAAVFSLLTLALVGCSAAGEGEPPGTVPSLSPAATPTASVPPLPAAAQGDGPEAASEFAKYYLAVVDDAFARADASALRALSDSGCGGCNSLIDLVEDLARDGQRYEGGQYVVQDAVAPGAETPDYLVVLTYTRPEGRVIDAATGDEVRTETAQPKTQMQMRVVKEGGSWRTFGLRT